MSVKRGHQESLTRGCACVRGCTGASTLDAIICVSLFSLVLAEAAEAKRTRYLSSFFALCPLLSRAAQRALALPGLRPAFCWKLGKKRPHVTSTSRALSLSLSPSRCRCCRCSLSPRRSRVCLMSSSFCYPRDGWMPHCPTTTVLHVRQTLSDSSRELEGVRKRSFAKIIEMRNVREERKEAKIVLFLCEHFLRKADNERHSRGGREREVSEGRQKRTKSWLSFSPSGKSLQAFAETMLLLLALQHTLKGEFGSARTRYITKKDINTMLRIKTTHQISYPTPVISRVIFKSLLIDAKFRFNKLPSTLVLIFKSKI